MKHLLCANAYPRLGVVVVSLLGLAAAATALALRGLLLLGRALLLRTALRRTALRRTALRRTTLRRTALRRAALGCTAALGNHLSSHDKRAVWNEPTTRVNRSTSETGRQTNQTVITLMLQCTLQMGLLFDTNILLHSLVNV